MSSILTLISDTPFITLPPDLLGWSGFIVLLILVLIIQFKWRRMNRAFGHREWGIFIALLVLTPLTSLFIGIRLPGSFATGGLALTPLDVYQAPVAPAIMIFSALPWMLAAGLLGPLAAGGIALLAGLLVAIWQTHTLFTALELTLLATLFSVSVRQPYRTPIFRLLRRPLASAALAALF
jgi:hypothetical protein